MKTKFKNFLMILIICLVLLYSKASGAEKINFKDLKEEAWYYKDMSRLLEAGHIKGYPDQTIRPDRPISFGEFLKLSMSAIKNQDYPKGENFWWEEVYMDANIEAIIDMENFPMDENFINSPLSREDMAYIIIGINENIQKEPSLELNQEPSIADLNQVEDFKKPALIQAYAKGLLRGKEDGFKPQAKTSRAQAATVINRILDRKKD